MEFQNAEYCIPMRWEIHGYNTNGGSHYDFYQMDYEEFDNIPVLKDEMFARPQICEGVTTKRQMSGFDLFFSSQNQTAAQKNLKLVQQSQEDMSMTF